MDIQKYLLHYSRMPFSAGSTKVVEADVEPLVYFRVDFKVSIANFSRGFLLLDSLDLSRSSILISSANIENICSLQLFIARVDICGQDTSDDVPQMGYVIHVWESGGDKNVLLAFLRETFVCVEVDLLC